MSGALWNLLISFLQIGLFSFGGGYATIPLIQEQVVTMHKWLTFQEFADIITISQMTPGPVAVNTSTFVGIQIAGLPGAIVATFGCILSGFIISISLFRFFQKHHDNAYIQHILNGLKASSCGLIASSASTIILLAFFNVSSLTEIQSFNIFAGASFLVCFFLIRKYKWNPMLIMVIAGGLGLVFYL